MDETQDGVRDDAFPAGTTQRVLGSVEKYPGVETRLLLVEPMPDGPALALRDFLIGEQRYVAGIYVFPPKVAEQVALMIIQGVARAR